jgi:hypothetical protein
LSEFSDSSDQNILAHLTKKSYHFQVVEKFWNFGDIFFEVSSFQKGGERSHKVVVDPKWNKKFRNSQIWNKFLQRNDSHFFIAGVHWNSFFARISRWNPCWSSWEMV